MSVDTVLGLLLVFFLNIGKICLLQQPEITAIHNQF